MENKELALSVEEKPKLSTAAHLMAGWPLYVCDQFMVVYCNMVARLYCDLSVVE